MKTYNNSQNLKTIKVNYGEKVPENYTGIVEFTGGMKKWFLNGKCHRENGPAIEHFAGAKEWYRHGKRHREDGPAVELNSGTKYWFLNGKLHREADPAVEYSSGYKEYWYNDKMLNKDKIQFFMKDLGFPVETAIKLIYHETTK